MNLKELEKQAYDMMLLNPNSEQYKQVRAYINQIKDKEITLTKEFSEKLKSQANETINDSDIEDDVNTSYYDPSDIDFYDGGEYGTD
jgi:hypothetical protein